MTPETEKRGEKEKRSFRNGRLRVCLIHDAETPCMAYLWVRKEYGNGFNVETATYDCAADVGEINGYDLTERECVWLNSLRDVCAAWHGKTRIVEVKV